jgi:hypothetical protein
VHHDFRLYSVTYGIVKTKQKQRCTHYVHRTGFLEPSQHSQKLKTAGKAENFRGSNFYSWAAMISKYDIIDSCASAKSAGGAK